MRHQKTGRKFGRTSDQRKAMFKNMVISLIEIESIKTTVPKAKELRGVFEPLVTLAKVDSVANRRRAFSKLRNDSAVGKLFSDLGPRFMIGQVDILELLKWDLGQATQLQWLLLSLLKRLKIHLKRFHKKINLAFP